MGEALVDLEFGTAFRFADWPNRDVPMQANGVYTIWESDRLVYVGMAGKGVAVAELNDAGQPVKLARGLYGRLNTHASGTRIGDPFATCACDRFVVPALSRKQLTLLAAGQVDLDELTKAHIRRCYEYRYITTTTGWEATRIADQVRRGRLNAGPPLLHPDALTTTTALPADVG